MQILSKPMRLPRFSAYVPEPEDPAIFWFNSERDDIIAEITRRMVERHGSDCESLEYTLNEVAFHEARRLEKQHDEEAKQALGFWKGLLRRIARMDDEEKRRVLAKITSRMGQDIAGNFDPRVYRFACRLTPQLLTGVMRPGRLPQGLSAMLSSNGSTEAGLGFEEMVRTEGDIELLHRLEKVGTLVYVPTHASNLDSIAFGYALQREELAPVIYGAGKNLFSNPIISFFMHNLGAYRVDRRVRARLYKDILKTFSCVMIERGYHSLFFPGGTRSRSGMVERKLKLGLAGTGVEAFSRNQVFGIKRPVWFVPVTINYGLVMEAESLIQDHLKEQGGDRYIVDNDEFSRLDRWVTFFRKLIATDSACVIRFGRPIDPFGNPVDDEGHSLAPDGRKINAGDYVTRRGEPILDGSRDAAYTRELGEQILEAYRRETVIMPTHLVAHVMFRHLVRETPGLDLFSRMRLRGEVQIERGAFIDELKETQDRVRAMEEAGDVRLSESVRDRGAEALLVEALHAWDGYHTQSVITHTGGDLVVGSPALVLFYHNRLLDYAEALAGEGDEQAVREIGLMGAHT